MFKPSSSSKPKLADNRKFVPSLCGLSMVWGDMRPKKTSVGRTPDKDLNTASVFGKPSSLSQRPCFITVMDRHCSQSELSYPSHFQSPEPVVVFNSSKMVSLC